MEKKKLNRLYFALPVIVIVFWFVASWYISKKTEEGFSQFIESHGLSDVVHWQDIDSGLFSKTSVNDVTLNLGQDEFFIKKLIINKIKDSSDKKYISLDINALATSQGEAPDYIVETIGYRVGRTSLKPIDASLTLDLDHAANTASLDMSLMLPDEISFSVALNAKNIRGFDRLLDQEFSSFSALEFYTLTQSLSQVAVTNAEIEIKDKGALKRYVELDKRYKYTLNPANGSADKERNTLHAIDHDEALESCIRNSPAFMLNETSSCKAIYHFLAAKKDSINVTVIAQKPLSLMAVADAVMGQGAFGEPEVATIEFK